MKLKTNLLMLSSLSLVTAGVTNAAVITVNWTDGGPGTGNAVAGESAGVVASPFINTVSGNASALTNTSTTDLFDDSGAGSGVGITATGINAGGFTATPTSGFNTASSNTLMRNYGDTANGTVSLTGLSTWLTANGHSSYAVYFMTDREVNLYSGSISNGVETIFIANGGTGNSQAGPFVRGTDTTLAAAQANANTANYVQFAAQSSDTINLTISRNGGGGFININGLQVVGITAPVPEPSSTALLGLGGLALFLRRRK